MANNPHFSLAWRNQALNQLTASLGTSALLQVYAGVQPADVSSAVTAANVILASLTCPTTNAFAAATAGVITANSIGSASAGTAGTATWFSFVKTTGTRVFDGSIGTSGADLNLNTASITTGATVAVSAFTVTIDA